MGAGIAWGDSPLGSTLLTCRDPGPKPLDPGVGHIYILITCNFVYIYNKIEVYSVNGKANLHIDIRNLILINMCLVSLFF